MAEYPDWWMQGPPVVADATGKVATGKLDATLAALANGAVTALHAHAVAEDTPVNAVASTLSTNLAGNNNDLVFTAVVKGVIGDSITIEYVDPEEETASETVTVTGTAISVTLRSVSSTLSTAAQVTAAIEAEPLADALVTVANKAANDGTGVVIAMTATPLAGGVDGTEASAGELRFDADYLYLAVAENTTADTNWRRIDIGTAY